MEYTKKVVIRTLQCSHPAVVGFWETGGLPLRADDNRMRHHFHIITIDEKRFDVECIPSDENPYYEREAFAKIDEWLDKQYPTIKEALEKIK